MRVFVFISDLYSHFIIASSAKSGSVQVKVGDTAKKCQRIGVMGMTGRNTGIHLHFGMKENSTYYDNGAWMNPEPYLTGQKVIGAAETVKPDTKPTGEIKVSDKVKLLNAVTYDGKSFRVWFDVYDVLQVTGDRVVIGIGNIITTAVRVTDVKRV